MFYNVTLIYTVLLNKVFAYLIQSLVAFFSKNVKFVLHFKVVAAEMV